MMNERIKKNTWIYSLNILYEENEMQEWVQYQIDSILQRKDLNITPKIRHFFGFVQVKLINKWSNVNPNAEHFVYLMAGDEETQTRREKEIMRMHSF